MLMYTLVGLHTAFGLWKGGEKKGQPKSKSDMLFALAKRALHQGHYLVAYHVYYYGLHRAKSTKGDTWFCFAETLKHLGRLDESKQALEAAVTLEPMHSMAITALSQWRPSVTVYVDELAHMSDVDRIRRRS
jgi:hypothetical protein